MVYKVDRLTRSITDFGKLVEVFDQQEVSFVSVTQAFNTTNSMGRLTLNVLLSFAQFEREVTVERIRDKIAASKQNGMWMGGHVPFGYKNQDKQLSINDEESKTSRLIFELYREHKNTRMVKDRLDELSIVSRRRINKRGQALGGCSFSRGNISSILSNPIYAGNICHKGKVYSGNHRPIIGQDDWNEIQALMAKKRKARTNKMNASSPGLLNGLLHDDSFNQLVLHHANKKGQKYHYYVSKIADDGETETKLRLPLQMIENVVKEILIDTLKSDTEVLASLSLKKTSAEKVNTIIETAMDLANEIYRLEYVQLKILCHQLVTKIIIQLKEITLELNPIYLNKKLNTDLSSETRIEFRKSISIKRRGQENKIVVGGLASKPSNIDYSLIKMVAKAHLLKSEIQSGKVNSLKEFAELHNMDHADARNLMPLSYLALSIIEDILDGRQPANLTTKRLKSTSFKLPTFDPNKDRHSALLAKS